jgi:DNA-directed RNA polymerase subunit RPC12/RpoP
MINMMEQHDTMIISCGDPLMELLKDVRELLKEQEAKTGKWIEQTDYMGDTYYDCSACNESWMTIEGTPWVNGMNYCPHCGAKMEFEGR